jgi:hypothetical protein
LKIGRPGRRLGTGTGQSNRFDFRHEIEYGVTDRTSLAVYVADWKVVNGQAYLSRHCVRGHPEPHESRNGPHWFSAVWGSEAWRPVIQTGRQTAVAKKLGPIVLAYNAGIEAEMGRSFVGTIDEDSGEFMESFGISYQVTPKFFLGGEFLQESAIFRMDDCIGPFDLCRAECFISS